MISLSCAPASQPTSSSKQKQPEQAEHRSPSSSSQTAPHTTDSWETTAVHEPIKAPSGHASLQHKIARPPDTNPSFADEAVAKGDKRSYSSSLSNKSRQTGWQSVRHCHKQFRLISLTCTQYWLTDWAHYLHNVIHSVLSTCPAASR